MLSEPPRCRPVPVLALKGADSPRGLHRGHSPGHWSPPGARSTGGGWSLPASWPDPNSLRQGNPDHDERYRGGQSLCYVGDLAHHPVLLLEKPLTEFKYDTDPKQSAQTRVKMLTMLADKKIPLLAYHFAWPGIGHVAKQGDGFRYYPEAVKMEL